MVEVVTLARPYAKAAFTYAKAHDALKAWSSMLHLAAQIAVDKQVQQLINDPRISEDKLLNLFLDVGKQVFNDPFRNILQLLFNNNRVLCLPEIALLFEQYRSLEEKTLNVEISSALPLTDKQKDRFRVNLKRRFARDILLQFQVDAKLIGGAIIRAGDTVIDGSVLGKLNQLADNLSGRG